MVTASVPPITPAAIALNRFGLGARPDDPPPSHAVDWLHAQIETHAPAGSALPAAWSAQPMTPVLAQRLGERRRALQDAADQDRPALRKSLDREMVEIYQDAVYARLTGALITSTPFIERLVYFWANHFAVSTEKQPVALFAGAFEMEAIRPHVLGRFTDMLMAVEQHPAMMFYLDQNASVGPNSPAALRSASKKPERTVGLNENLAREAMELHTLGVRSGYAQNDVTEFARTLTGWSIGGINQNDKMAGLSLAPGQFIFRARQHEPGERTIMGRRYDQPGEAQGLAVLLDLARSPATAHHVAEKLARHFVADTPPPALVDRLANTFSTSGGNLTAVYRVLIDSPEAWHPVNTKFKTPWDWTVSSMRGFGLDSPGKIMGKLPPATLLTQLGQPVWRPGSPAGYDDLAASWAAPDALVRRVEIAQRAASAMGDQVDARALAPRLLVGSLSQSTANQIARAESAQSALSLLLVSPDFLRR